MSGDNGGGDLLVMTKHHYPGLYQGANTASLSAQKTYFLIQKAYLVSVVLGAVLGFPATLVSRSIQVYFYVTMAVLLAIGFLSLWIGRARRDDETWFDCRAVAESVKTATWRYIMNAPPFDGSGDMSDAFTSELREIRDARQGCLEHLAGVKNASLPNVSELMVKAKAQAFQERKQFYIRERLGKQRKWYTDKAKANADMSAGWFWIVIGCQVAAISMAIILAVIGGPAFNVVSIITTAAAIAVAWSQMKRFGELAKSYELAVQELGDLEALIQANIKEEDFLQLVVQVEEAISREHTMWCARRDVLPAKNTRRPMASKGT